jgi:hypothetical protein
MTNQLSPLAEVDLNKEVLENSVVHTNVGQEFVVTTSDKIRLSLKEYQSALKAQNDWVAPLGIFLALLPSLVAADFKSFIGITAEMWKSLFFLGTIGCIIWLIKTIYWAIKLRKISNIEYIIEKMKLRGP